MAASPEADPPPETESADMHPSPSPPSSPPAPCPAQESSSLATASPPEAAHPGHATLAPTPPLEQATPERPEADEPPPPIDDGADPLPLLPHPPEVAPAASAVLEAISTEKPASPLPRREDVAVEVSPDVAASAASPPPSPQIGEASPEDAPPPPSPPPTPPDTTSRGSPDPPTVEAAAMPSQEAAWPPPAPESMDADSQTAPAPLTPPLESGPEGLSPQQQPRPPSPEMAPPLFENSEPEQTPSPLPPPAESTHAFLDGEADEVVAVVSEASASPPALEAMDGETTTAPGVPPALESGVEVSLQEPVQTSSSRGMEAEPCSPEMAPPGFENFKSQWLALTPPTLPAEFTDSLVEAAATNAVAVGMMLEAAAGSVPALEAMDAEMDISPGLQPPLKSGAEGQLQQQLLGSSSPMAQAAPCSPDMPPPGFENCKLSWIPLPTLAPPAETTYSLPDVAATNEVKVMCAEKACSVPALEATDVGTNTVWSLLPPMESGAGGSLQGPLPRAPSPTIQAAPCSPDMEPPGFENFRSSQLQLPTPPLLQTACINIMQDSATTGTDEVVAVDVQMEAPQPSALKEMDVHMDATSALPLPSDNQAGGSLPHKSPQLPSQTMHGTVCSLEMVTSGYENVVSSQLLPSASVLPLVQTPDALTDAMTKKTVTVEEVCHPLYVVGAVEEAKGSILPPPLENGCEGPLQCLEPQVSSPMVQAAPSSPEIAPAGFENLESSQPTSLHLAETIDPSPQACATKSVAVKSEETAQLPSSLQATYTDLEIAIALQSPSKSGEGSLPQPQHHPSSPSVQDAPCSPEMAPPGYEKLDSLEQPLLPPPPLCTKFEMGQMVCGCCRELLAYPRGAVHVQCSGCLTINLVLEEHQVGKAYCGQCETLLMYPFGAPAVRCSTCLFVTKIGDQERNVRRRILMEQGGSPHPKEQTPQELSQA
ncbi:uncharacterized protein LOC133907164 [Phragmites australis]|uniref:uncharacterized protein LOC133907164 n=1 Tax=Phragmites australis TaxID=29695 RepID=UPI002D7A01D3|nr:uncharacterized protein LOC133907164 [Phragmites australis]